MNGNLVVVYPDINNNITKPEAGVLVGGYLFIRRNGQVSVILLPNESSGGVEHLDETKVPYNFLTIADKFLAAQALLNSLLKEEVFDKAEAALEEAENRRMFKTAGQGGGK